MELLLRGIKKNIFILKDFCNIYRINIYDNVNGNIDVNIVRDLEPLNLDMGVRG